MLYEDGVLVAFTNIDDCEKHIRGIGEGRYFHLGSMPFTELIRLADDEGKDVFIDIQDELNCQFIAYEHKTRELKAVMLSRMPY